MHFSDIKNEPTLTDWCSSLDKCISKGEIPLKVFFVLKHIDLLQLDTNYSS